MSESKSEEIISALWAIAALLAFSGGHDIWGWIFAIKAALDTVASIFFALLGIIRARRLKNNA